MAIQERVHSHHLRVDGKRRGLLCTQLQYYIPCTCYYVCTKLAAPRSYFFWPAFVARILTSRLRKFGYGLLLGCRSGLDGEPFETTFFDDARTSNPKPGKVFTLCSSSLSQSIERNRIGREGALDVRESRGRRDKILAEKTEKRQNFGSETTVFNGEFSFFGRGKTNFFREGGGGYNFKTD